MAGEVDFSLFCINIFRVRLGASHPIRSQPCHFRFSCHLQCLTVKINSWVKMVMSLSCHSKIIFYFIFSLGSRIQGDILAT